MPPPIRGIEKALFFPAPLLTVSHHAWTPPSRMVPFWSHSKLFKPLNALSWAHPIMASSSLSRPLWSFSLPLFSFYSFYRNSLPVCLLIRSPLFMYGSQSQCKRDFTSRGFFPLSESYFSIFRERLPPYLGPRYVPHLTISHFTNYLPPVTYLWFSPNPPPSSKGLSQSFGKVLSWPPPWAPYQGTSRPVVSPFLLRPFPPKRPLTTKSAPPPSFFFPFPSLSY